MIPILKRYKQLQFKCQQYIALASYIKHLMEMSVTVTVLLELFTISDQKLMPMLATVCCANHY